MLGQIDTDLWVIERAHRYLGVEIETRMTVIKLADGSLFVHSPVRLDEVTRASMDKLGPVKHVVAPNRFHHLFVSDYPKIYPDVKIYGAPGLDTKRPDLHFDAILSEISHRRCGAVKSIRSCSVHLALLTRRYSFIAVAASRCLPI